MNTMAISTNHELTKGQKTQAHASTDDHSNGVDSEKKAEVTENIAPEVPHSAPYSLFDPTQKGWILFIAAWAGWFSTASSFIYFPAIPFLAGDMNVSVQDINLTVTSYLIASGIFPTVTGSVADVYGRRYTLIVSLIVYTLVNISLASQRSFAALFMLRMLQSAAISGNIHLKLFTKSKYKYSLFTAGFSITYGLLGDLTTPAERGGYTGVVSILYVQVRVKYNELWVCIDSKASTRPPVLHQ